MNFYRKNQFEMILPYLKGKPTPQWLILGGPADGNEAQCAAKHSPKIRVVGVEPSSLFRRFQFANGWKVDWPLYRCALGATLDPVSWAPGLGETERDRHRTGGLDCEGASETFDGVTLDYLDSVEGPFPDSILWLDIEGSEYQALLGARGMLSRGLPILLNVEVMRREVETKGRQIDGLLAEFGYFQCGEWSYTEHHSDRVYSKGGK